MITNYGDWIMEITSANNVQRYFAKKKKNHYALLRYVDHGSTKT